jgi:hypothetical protein
MRYALLIYGNEAMDATMTPAQGEAQMAAYNTYTEALGKAGLMRGGDALQPTATATTVRVRGGKTLTTDGPFAETKEQLGGFYLIECDNLDLAIEWAAKIPHAASASIEVRPIMEM